MRPSSPFQRESALQFLAEAGAALARSLEYEQTLETVARVLVPRYAGGCVITLVADDGRLHRVAAAFADPAHEALARESGARSPIDPQGSHPVARVMRTRAPQLLDRASHDLVEGLCGLRGSAMSVPLQARGRLLGVLSVGTESDAAWDDDDLLFVQEVANRCAAAIDNACLYRESRANERRLRLLAEFSFAISSARRVEEAIQAMASRIVPSFAEQCVVEICSAEGPYRRIASVYLDESKAAIAREMAALYPGHLNPKSVTREVRRTGAPVLFSAITDQEIDAIAQDERHRRMIKAIDCQSGIIAPLESRDAPLGFLFLGSERPNRFTSQDLEFSVDLARRFAVAYDNARLFEETEAARQRLALLSEASAVLASSIDLKTTLDNALKVVVPGLADFCAVYTLENNRLTPARIGCSDAAMQRSVEELLGEHPLPLNSNVGSPKAARTGTAELVAEFTDEYLAQLGPERERVMREGRWRSGIFAPIATRGKVRGALTLLRNAGRPRFAAEELTLAQELGRRAAVAMENASLYEAAERGRREARAALASAEKAELRLRRSNEELQQFAYVASHDLQEPLRSIGSFTELLTRKHGKYFDADSQEIVGYITSSVRRMNDLVRDLLAYSRLSREAEVFENVDSGELARAAIQALAASIEESGATVACEELPVVMASKLLLQVFQNLIGNAIKYRAANPPHIRIWAERHPGEWRFAVQDNGTGFDPQFAETIFHVFKRLHGRDVPGTGMGLAICKKIVEGCGGKIWVNSTPGRGSTFWFTIPDPDVEGPAAGI